MRNHHHWSAHCLLHMFGETNGLRPQDRLLQCFFKYLFIRLYLTRLVPVRSNQSLLQRKHSFNSKSKTWSHYYYNSLLVVLLVVETDSCECGFLNNHMKSAAYIVLDELQLFREGEEQQSAGAHRSHQGSPSPFHITLEISLPITHNSDVFARTFFHHHSKHN